MAKGKTVGPAPEDKEEKGMVLATRNDNVMSIPDYLLNDTDEDSGADRMSEYVVPPRFKIVQSASDKELKDAHPPGTLLLMPQQTVIAAMNYDGPRSIDGDKILLTPLFFFTEFLDYNPIQLKGQLPTFRERTFDASSPLAQRARDLNRSLVPCPTNTAYMCRAVECLNFIVAVYKPGQSWLDAHIGILSFQRGEFRTGSSFITLITGRRSRGKIMKIYSGIYSAYVPGEVRVNEKGSWYGLNINNPDPAESPAYHLPEDYAFMRMMYKQYKELFDKKLLRPDYEEPTTAVPAGAEGNPDF